MENVLIKRYTEQRYSTHTDSNQEVFTGKLAYKGDNLYITYIEEAEGNKITNYIKISSNKAISIKRMGIDRTNLCFAKDKPYTTLYKTAYGNMELTFVPTLVDYKSSQKSHMLRLQYDIYMADNKLSQNKYFLEIS